MRDDVARVAKGRPCHWVTVHDIAQRLGVKDEVSAAAVRHASSKAGSLLTAIRRTACASAW